MNAGLLTSNSAEWATPQDLFDELQLRYGPFDLDPAATPENAKCARFFTAEDDGLSQKWEAQHVWLNPPYGKTIRIPIGNADIKIEVSDKPMTDDEHKKWAKRISEQMMSFGVSDSDDEMLKAIHGAKLPDASCPNFLASETPHRHGPPQDPHVCPMTNIVKLDGMTAVQLCQCCEWCESNCWEDANK